MNAAQLAPYLSKIKLPLPDSHKGQNGKVMVIGGSELFHAASQWSLLVVSRMVDMVFYSSVPSNNELIKESKLEFHNGIVVERENIHDYINEADVVLIGPGMDRSPETENLTNELLDKYQYKKWVVDAGALQMVEPFILTSQTIITPHQKEFEELMKKTGAENYQLPSTCLLKGPTDFIFNQEKKEKITAGNEGMTKGGTGDVLAGLVAGLYAFTDDPFAAAVIGSYVNKASGDELYKSVGPFFNATDLANQIPHVLAKLFKLV